MDGIGDARVERSDRPLDTLEVFADRIDQAEVARFFESADMLSGGLALCVEHSVRVCVAGRKGLTKVQQVMRVLPILFDGQFAKAGGRARQRFIPAPIGSVVWRCGEELELTA